MSYPPQVKKILILAANPKNTDQLRLGEEVAKIQKGLERSRHRNQFELISRWAVQIQDFYRYMLDVQPQIVHFSGHGGGESGIVLEDEQGKAQFLITEQLTGMFKLFARRGVECVLLNACYSEVQAEAMCQHVNYVIGMNQAIGDQAAINFAVTFYDALGAGETVEFAYELGCTRLMGLKDHEIPVLKQRPGIAVNATVALIAQVDPKEQALKLLKALLSSQFDHVVFKYGVDPAYLAANTSQAQTAIAVIRYAEQKEGVALAKLLKVIFEVAPHMKG